MNPPDSFLYEYAVIRFVPRVDREEFINIGLIMMSKRNKWLKSMVILDEERIKALYPNVDIDCLRNQSRLFEMTDVPSSDLPIEEKYRWLTANKSACLQISPSHPGFLSPSHSDFTSNSSSFSESESQSGSESELSSPSQYPFNPSLHSSAGALSKDRILSLLNLEFSRLFSSLIL